MQLEKGEEATAYEEYGVFTLDKLKIDSDNKNNKIYTFADAWIKWTNGEKFAIGFLGDSTTDGANTTGWTYDNGHENMDKLAGGWGKHDYINTNAYPYKLQELLRKELSNEEIRVYNIGYSGTQFHWAKPKYDDIFGGVYSDVKMVGITYGINDRGNYSSPKSYYEGYKNDLIYTVEYLYKKGIQPFLVTSQATIEPYIYSSFVTDQPLRTTEMINSIANRVKFEVAQLYDLEIIDMTKFTEHILNYSEYNISDICPDHLHFGDLGHTLESYFLLSQFSPRVVKVENGSLLTFACQSVKSKVNDDKLNYLAKPVDKLRIVANYTTNNANDMLIQDFWVNNTSKEKLNLFAYCTEVLNQYVMIDDERIEILHTKQLVSEIEIGVHHIQVFTGGGEKVNWLGFKIGTIG